MNLRLPWWVQVRKKDWSPRTLDALEKGAAPREVRECGDGSGFECVEFHVDWLGEVVNVINDRQSVDDGHDVYDLLRSTVHPGVGEGSGHVRWNDGGHHSVRLSYIRQMMENNDLDHNGRSVNHSPSSWENNLPEYDMGPDKAMSKAYLR